jgi:clan AA aspartic protease
MGEVHVRVRLTNALDIQDVERGLLDPAKVRTCEIDALVDTGSTRSFIPASLSEQLGLGISHETKGILADGTKVSVLSSTAIVFEIEGRKTIEGAYILGDQVLIGQTTLQTTDLLVDCANRKVIPGHAEGPIFRL